MRFADILYSLKKSYKLRKLQKIIQTPLALDSLDFESVMDRDGIRASALKEFLDLCANDPAVSYVMAHNHLSSKDLEQIYFNLLCCGAGQWLKGHYVALSTIAYGEPLQFYILAGEKGMPDMERAYVLLQYWDGKIRTGQLLSF